MINLQISLEIDRLERIKLENHRTIIVLEIVGGLMNVSHQTYREFERKVVVFMQPAGRPQF